MTNQHVTQGNLLNWQVIDRVTDVVLKNQFGDFSMGCFKTVSCDKMINHLLIYKGLKQPVPLRIQSGCLSSGIAGDTRCDCHVQLTRALEHIEAIGNGLIIYSIEHDGRGRGLLNKLKVYKLRDKKNITSRVACDELGYVYEQRSYLPIVSILENLGINKVILLSRSSTKYNELIENGINILATKSI